MAIDRRLSLRTPGLGGWGFDNLLSRMAARSVCRLCCACVGMCMFMYAPVQQGVWARQPASTESTDLPNQEILCSSRPSAPLPCAQSAVLVVHVELLWRTLWRLCKPQRLH